MRTKAGTDHSDGLGPGVRVAVHLQHTISPPTPRVSSFSKPLSESSGTTRKRTLSCAADSLIRSRCAGRLVGARSESCSGDSAAELGAGARQHCTACEKRRALRLGPAWRCRPRLAPQAAGRQRLVSSQGQAPPARCRWFETGGPRCQIMRYRVPMPVRPALAGKAAPARSGTIFCRRCRPSSQRLPIVCWRFALGRS